MDYGEFKSMVKSLIEASDEEISLIIKAIDEDANKLIGNQSSSRSKIVDLQEFKYFVNRYAFMFLNTEVEPEEQKELEEEESEQDRGKSNLRFNLIYKDGWHWSEKSSMKSEAIKLKRFGLTAYRPDQDGHRNPCIFTASSFNYDVNRFRCQIKTIGSWIAIGIAEYHEYQVNGGSVLGSQEKGFNCCLYSQTKSSFKICDRASVPLGGPLAVGDVIDIQIDFGNQKIKFWKNLVFQGEIKGKEINLLNLISFMKEENLNFLKIIYFQSFHCLLELKLQSEMIIQNFQVRIES